MTLRPAIVVMAAAVAGLVALAAFNRPAPEMFGFTRTGAMAEASFERGFLRLPDARHLEREHRVQAEQPHMAGTSRDFALMTRTRDLFAQAGLDKVEVTTHEVLLPWPEELVV